MLRLLGVIVGILMIIGGMLGMVVGSLAKWVALFSACFALYQSAGLGTALWAAVIGFFSTIGVLIIGFIVMTVGVVIFFLSVK